jgi:hypothetical protein
MANLQKRGNYTPRSNREQRAFRLVQAGAVTGGAGVVTLVLAVAGVMGLGIPILLLILTAVIAWRFTVVTGQR